MAKAKKFKKNPQGCSRPRMIQTKRGRRCVQVCEGGKQFRFVKREKCGASELDEYSEFSGRQQGW